MFLSGCKLEVVAAKKVGKTDESASDPIPYELFLLLLSWSLEEGNVFMWFWTLSQWYCMAQCASIDPLGSHNFSIAQDSVKCIYDDSKADKEGDKLSVKNIYANPHDYKQCWWTGLAIYCALNAETLGRGEKLFLATGTKDGSAATRYQEQLMGLVQRRKDVVKNHIRLEHTNAYGLRKGSATLSTSGTTAPPPISSIARRGEWSMGKVLDVYWHFSEPGDHYLGRILAGLDPSLHSFGCLPPHFKTIAPLKILI